MQRALRCFVHAVVAGGLLTGASLAGSLPGQVPAPWGLGGGGGPVDHHAAPAPVTGQKAGATTTITDPAGDLYALTTLSPHPDPGRNVAIAGRSITAVIPKWLLGNPGSLTWFAGTYDTEIQYDRVPAEGTLAWSGALPSSGSDPVEETIDPTRDLTGASIAPAGASSLAFGLELAGPVTNGARFGFASFNLDNGGRWAGVGPEGDGTWYSYVEAGSTPFPWSGAGFEDITAADVTEAANGEIDLSMTFAGAVPSSFGPDDAAPTYVWFFDSDGNGSTGGSIGADVNAQIRWNPAGGFEAALRVWVGTHYEDLPSEAGSFSIVGNRVTLRTSLAALGLSPSFRWYAAAHVNVGPPEDAWQTRLDATDYVSMTLTGTSGVSLALENADAWVFSVPFAAADPAFGTAVGDLLINSAAHGYALDALGCEHVVCSVGTVAGAVASALGTYGGLLRIAPLAEGLKSTPPGFTATLSTGNDRLGAVVVLDFLGAGVTPPAFDGPLAVCLASPGAGPCSASRPLLSAGEIQGLPAGNSYVVVPKSTFLAPAGACALCGGAVETELRAEASLGGQALRPATSLLLETGGGSSSVVDLTAGHRTVVEPEPQTQSRNLTAYLEFGYEATARAKTAETCNVEVVVREAGGGISSRTTVPAVGLQSVDLGLRPPESWRLELRPTCAVTARVALADRSHRGIRACTAGATSLCLSDGRFRVEAEWQDFYGHSGAGHAVSLTADTGYFWFFGDNNLELLVKVLDGTAVNGNYWVFYGALSNVQYTLRVTDTETGAVRTYFNPSGIFASAGQTGAFAGTPTTGAGEAAAAEGSTAAAPLAPKAGTCAPSAQRLCLGDGRYAVEVAWKDFAGSTGAGQAVTLTGDTGLFWFFGANNLELAVKVLDGTSVNGHRWVFYGSLSSVEYTLTVTDTVTGAVRSYHNPPGQLGSFGDTAAF